MVSAQANAKELSEIGNFIDDVNCRVRSMGELCLCPPEEVSGILFDVCTSPELFRLQNFLTLDILSLEAKCDANPATYRCEVQHWQRLAVPAVPTPSQKTTSLLYGIRASITVTILRRLVELTVQARRGG